LKAETARLLKKASRAIHAAETLLKAGDADFGHRTRLLRNVLHGDSAA
jgi:hypothetical protein